MKTTYSRKFATSYLISEELRKVLEDEVCVASMNEIPSEKELLRIGERMHDAGFRFVGKHARIVTEYEWNQITKEPFVAESNRPDDEHYL